MNNAIDLNVTDANEIPEVMREAVENYDRRADNSTNPNDYFLWREFAQLFRLWAAHVETRLEEDHR